MTRDLGAGHMATWLGSESGDHALRLPALERTWLMGPIFVMFENCSYMMRSVNSPRVSLSISSCCWSSCARGRAGGQVLAAAGPQGTASRRMEEMKDGRKE